MSCPTILRDDIACYGRFGASGTRSWRVHIGNGSRFSTRIFDWIDWKFDGFATGDPTATPVAGDLDNDGFIDDVACFGYHPEGSWRAWRVHLGNVWCRPRGAAAKRRITPDITGRASGGRN